MGLRFKDHEPRWESASAIQASRDPTEAPWAPLTLGGGAAMSMAVPRLDDRFRFQRRWGQVSRATCEGVLHVLLMNAGDRKSGHNANGWGADLKQPLPGDAHITIMHVSCTVCFDGCISMN